MIDFTHNILDKADNLIVKAKVLPNISINWQKPILIECYEINKFEKGLDTVILQPLIENSRKPGIYYFRLIDISDTATLIKSLKEFKMKKKRSCPKIDSKRQSNSQFLYCGS